MKNNRYNLIVIGGGPAGMMAAGRAAENGATVLILEKNDRLGVKLLITGKGRCNITNAEQNLRTFISKFGKNGKFLYSAFNKFSNFDVVDFFENRGLAIKIERGNRVFPESDRSMDVLNCLEKYLEENKVDILYDSCVDDFVVNKDSKKIEKVILNNGEELSAESFVIATGGKSYPVTGSTGDAVKWLKKIGHNIIEPRPVLTPIILKERIVKELEGLSLKNVEVSLWYKNKKQDVQFGEAVFTGNGLSGPIVIDLSRNIDVEKISNLQLKIDFKPALDYQILDKRILKDFSEHNNKQFKNSLNKLLPQKLIPVIIRLSGIDENKKVNEIKKEERKKIVHLLKEFTFNVLGLVGFEKAIVTAGGVDLSEVNPQNMQSKLIENLYFAGEILDLDGPTGGYNLQVAWSTGYLIGDKIMKK